MGGVLGVEVMPRSSLVVSLNYAPEPTGNSPYSTGLAEGLAGSGHDARVMGLLHG